MAPRFAIAVTLTALLVGSEACAQQTPRPAEMRRLGEVDVRFQSYNIEMVTVTGGPFWEPYTHGVRPDRELFANRPPIDLSNARLRKLAAALGPAYVRVSGTWANATYFADTDAPVDTPPAGYNSVLTRTQWRGVVGFAAAVNAEVVTSFAVSVGSRNAAGAWTGEQAARLVDYTHTLGGHIAAAELMNEPDLSPQNAAPAGYDAAAYGRDVASFRAMMKALTPQALIAGPGTIADATPSDDGLDPRDLLAVTAADIDVVSYHHYGALSPRCGGRDDPSQALTDAWLARSDKALAYYTALRDRYAPGKPIWVTETADAACGGNAWDSTFLDSFRYLDQLGRLARAGVQVVMHNTLSGSDYGLLDERTFAPRPNYWAALLWHRLMGTTVLDAGIPAQAGLHVYAHCDPEKAGGVTVLAINISTELRTVTMPVATTRYALQSSRLQNGIALLNGKTLALGDKDAMPDLSGVPVKPGLVIFAPKSITFLVSSDADNAVCH